MTSVAKAIQEQQQRLVVRPAWLRNVVLLLPYMYIGCTYCHDGCNPGHAAPISIGNSDACGAYCTVHIACELQAPHRAHHEPPVIFRVAGLNPPLMTL